VDNETYMEGGVVVPNGELRIDQLSENELATRVARAKARAEANAQASTTKQAADDNTAEKHDPLRTIGPPGSPEREQYDRLRLD